VPQDLPEMTEGHAGSQVSPDTAGPKVNPPFHGVSTTQAQPRP
jgi:hypothetical protein